MAQDLIVFSHLRWSDSLQRPHQLMSRLAPHSRIFFFEEPLLREHAEPSLERTEVLPNLFVCQPQTPERVSGFHEKQLPYLDQLLADLIDECEIQDWVAWFYTPTAEPLIHDYEPAAVIYDSMAALHRALHRKQPLLQSESDLLQVADLVFTNTPGLHQLLQPHHEHVHCFFDSVETEHFVQAADSLPEHSAQSAIPFPRLGFFGTLDACLDFALLDRLARRHPEWQLVLAGPVIHMDDESLLPRHPNIHYLGRQRFEELPQLIAGWNLCILPFAAVDQTGILSPSKLLEYVASQRPIVSTAVAQLPGSFTGAVHFAGSHDEFIAACEQALAEAPDTKQERVARGRELLANTAWDVTASKMRRLLEAAVSRNRKHRLERRYGAPAPVALSERAPGNPSTRMRSEPVPVAVLGAGPTGLSAAYHLGEQALLIEAEAQVGGGCRSIEENGFTFDLGGHTLSSKHPYVQQLYQLLLGDNLHWQLRQDWVYSKNVYTRYPFQNFLYGLPSDVVQECILGAMTARVNAQSELLALSEERVHEGSLESTMPLNSQTIPFKNRRKEPRNLEDRIFEVFGAGIARNFLLPYNQKFWTFPLKELRTDALQGSPAEMDVEKVVAGALKPAQPDINNEDYFGYPLRGGMQALMTGFLPHLRCELRLNARTVAIDLAGHSLLLADGSRVRYQRLLTTMPLLQVLDLLRDQLPRSVLEAAQQLVPVSVRYVNLGIGREHVTDKHWIYYPEATVFHRIFAQGNASAHCNAPGGFGLTCEITYSAEKPLPKQGEGLIERCIRDCIQVGLIHSHDAIWAANELDVPQAYSLPNRSRDQHLEVIRQWLAGQDILTAGCFSEGPHYNADQAFLMGRQLAEHLLGRGLGQRAARG